LRALQNGRRGLAAEPGPREVQAVFRENDIDETVLPSLTHENLKELGVSSFGHRVKLLDAIAALRTDATLKASSAAVAPAQQSPATPSVTPVAEVGGERRHITVMFCDLVGSTSISAGLDAEEWRDLVGAYLDAASAAVKEMGGHVAKKLGDGLMALFGYPVAHENDAERAVRAALSIQRALAEVNRKNADCGKPALNARIGIETGPVVVDAAGEIYGDAPNTAARVQALAEPGTVVVTAQVQRQIAGLFVAEECGNHQLKGVPEPVTLFRLIRASGGGRRAGQRHLTPLVGRDEEIAMLMRRWERARQGEGHLVLIVGEQISEPKRRQGLRRRHYRYLRALPWKRSMSLRCLWRCSGSWTYFNDRPPPITWPIRVEAVGVEWVVGFSLRGDVVGTHEPIANHGSGWPLWVLTLLRAQAERQAAARSHRLAATPGVAATWCADSQLMERTMAPPRSCSLRVTKLVCRRQIGPIGWSQLSHS
jgi:class 3 adenylate cyclase